MNTLDPKFINQVLLGDCVELMAELPDECQVCSLYSPPYDAIRKYGGHRFDFEQFAKEVYRVTAQGGVAISVIQDQVVNGGFSGTQEEQCCYYKQLGFKLQNKIVLEIANGRFSHRIRYAPTHHTAFVFSKGRPMTANLLRDKPNRSAGGYKGKWFARGEDGEIVQGHYGKRIPPYGLRGDVWGPYIVGGNHSATDGAKHPSLMAEEMAEDLILSYSRPGDLVFDPLCGAGTSLKMALLHHRVYLGCEIHKPYWKEAVARLAKAEEDYKQQLDGELNKKIIVPSIQVPHHNGNSFEVPTIIFPSKARIDIKQADVLEALRSFDANTFDGLLFDPPYGLKFMGKKWDDSLPSVEVLQEHLRVCKPGSMLLAFGHPRTDHLLKTNIEKAGWILRDTMMWVYGTGKPKNRDISKDIDRLLGAVREKVRVKPYAGGSFGGKVSPRPWAELSRQNGYHEVAGPIPVTAEAGRWLGYGTALKPAYEPIVVAMKPLDGSVGKNALKWGVGGLNIDGSRIPCKDKAIFPVGYASDDGNRTPDRFPNGRYPTNLILDEEAGAFLDIENGYEPHEGPSRFFYCPKASPKERNAGLEGLPVKRPDERSKKGMGMWDKQGIQPQQNHHPTVKPLALCRYLANLILPPKGKLPRKLIVPYSGSGSEVIGAMMAGWDEVLGIEIDPEYVEIARRRIAYWRKGVQS